MDRVLVFETIGRAFESPMGHQKHQRINPLPVYKYLQRVYLYDLTISDIWKTLLSGDTIKSVIISRCVDMEVLWCLICFWV